METAEKAIITVQVTVNAPISKVWKNWITPSDIVRWNNANTDWHTPHAENDLRPGGKFNYRMEAKDATMGFDFAGVYDDVRTFKLIAYTLGDGRKVKVHFSDQGNMTEIVESFEAENTNPLEMQRDGWQAILDNFKKCTESD